jgi:hypothetical protein
VVDEENYDLQMVEDPNAQERSQRGNKGRYPQVSNVAFDFGVREPQLPLPQNPWHPGLQR